MKNTKQQEDTFDLPGFLLGKVYGYMDNEDVAHWCVEDANDVAHDLKLEGIEADPQEIYETIAEFITQDAEEEQR